MGTFRPLYDPRILLASPGDVAALRRLALRLVDRIEAENGNTGDIGLFAWELDEKETAYNDSVPIQSQIINPQDPLVRGLIAFFGERIGQPLAPDFPTDMLDSLPNLWTGGNYEGRTYKLVHECTPEEAADGGFALTGSTFEVLAVLAKARMSELLGDNRHIETFLCFASDGSVLANADPNAAHWGQHRHLDAIQKDFADNPLEMIRQIQLRHEQTQQLHNFACYLKSIGQEPKFIPEHRDITDALNTWYRQRFHGSKVLSEERTFHGLRFYDVDDHEAYFGRTEEIRRTVNVIADGLSDNSPNIHWIKGSSGVGKSSFLRAGILGRLVSQPDHATAFAHVIRRPNQLLTRAEAELSDARDPLRNLFEAALHTLPLLEEARVNPDRASNALGQYDSMPVLERPEWAARELDKSLLKIGGEKEGSRTAHLIFGIDQFEEIVDMIDDPDLGPCWAGCLAFLLELTKGKRTFILATIREERIPKMQSHTKLGPLWAQSAHQQTLLEFPGTAGLEDIVKLPFIKVGQAVLEPELIHHLVANIVAYKSTHDSAEAGSVMPLVSLMLERLHQEVGKSKWQDINADSVPSAQNKEVYARAAKGEHKGRITGSITISLADANGYDHLEGAISELGERSLKMAGVSENIKSDTTHLDSLLRRLLHWAGDNEDKQFSLPSIPMPSDENERVLAKAMLKNRLLVDEGGGLIRLVHETVVRNWEVADAFRERERPLEQGCASLRPFASVWNMTRRAADMVEKGADLFGAVAIELLTLWGHRFNQFEQNPDAPDEDLMLRDYCLAILAFINEPTQIVDRSPYKSSHIHIATAYSQADIVAAMVEKDPNSVKQTRSDGRTPLFATCFLCDVETLNVLLPLNPDLSQAEEIGWQPLHAAAVGGDVEFYKLLIRAGASINLDTAPNNCHPIHLAAQDGQLDLLDYFISEEDIDINLPDEINWTPLNRCIGFTGNVDSTKFLLERKADYSNIVPITYESTLHGSAMHQAAYLGRLGTLEALLDFSQSQTAGKTEPLENGMELLHLSALGGHHGTVQFLIERVKQVDELDGFATFELDKGKLASIKPDDTSVKSLRNWTALHMAVSNGHYKVVEALLKAGANPNIKNAAGDTPLHIAVNKNNSDILRLLCSKSDFSTTNASDQTALNLAIKLEHLGLARTLVSLGANPDQTMNLYGYTNEHSATLAHVEATDKNTAKLRFALTLGCATDLPDCYERLPLHYAASKGISANVDLLLKQDASAAGHQDLNQHTPLDLACLSGDFETVSIILHTLKRSDTVLQWPLTLHHAAIGGSIRICRLLVSDYGYTLDSLDAIGQTPVICAIRAGQTRTANWCLDHGANILLAINDRIEVNALRIAIECRESQIVKYMLKNSRPESVNYNELIIEAIEQVNLEAASILIEWAGEVPKNDIAEKYQRKMAQLDEKVPQHTFRSDAFETMLSG